MRFECELGHRAQLSVADLKMKSNRKFLYRHRQWPSTWKGVSSFFFFTLLDFYRLFYFKHAGHRHWCIYIYIRARTHLDRIFFLFGAGTFFSFFFLHSHPHAEEREGIPIPAHLHTICTWKLSPIPSYFLFFLTGFFFSGPGDFSFSFEREKKKNKHGGRYYYKLSRLLECCMWHSCWPDRSSNFRFFSFFLGWLSSTYILASIPIVLFEKSFIM